MEDHCRSSPQKITMGVHHRRSPWEFTAEDHRGSSLWKFTVEDHHRRSLWEITAGVYTHYTYHWLPLATIYFVGDNREFEV